MPSSSVQSKPKPKSKPKTQGPDSHHQGSSQPGSSHPGSNPGSHHHHPSSSSRHKPNKPATQPKGNEPAGPSHGQDGGAGGPYTACEAANDARGGACFTAWPGEEEYYAPPGEWDDGA